MTEDGCDIRNIYIFLNFFKMTSLLLDFTHLSISRTSVIFNQQAESFSIHVEQHPKFSQKSFAAHTGDFEEFQLVVTYHFFADLGCF